MHLLFKLTSLELFIDDYNFLMFLFANHKSNLCNDQNFITIKSCAMARLGESSVLLKFSGTTAKKNSTLKVDVS
jgi:hypothetical protein